MQISDLISERERLLNLFNNVTEKHAIDSIIFGIKAIDSEIAINLEEGANEQATKEDAKTSKRNQKFLRHAYKNH